MSEQTLREALKALLEVQDEKCRWDHNGYCQAHNLDHQLDGCRVEKARALLSAPVAQPVAQPLLKTVERILDDHSAWVAAPNKDVARAIAIAAGVVAQEMAREIAMNLVDRAQKIFLQAIPNSEMVTSEDYNPVKAWVADATKFLKETQGK